MIRLDITAHIRFLTISARLSAISLLLLIFAPTMWAQQDAGATTPSVAPGAPAGSYALNGFETVNLFNGNLDFHLPLMQVGGRGAAGYTMTLPIQTRWKIFKGIYETFPNYYQAFYPPVTTDWYAGDKPGYGVGRLIGRGALYTPPSCNEFFGGHGLSVMRLYFIAADGTEYELRDQLYDGRPQSSTYCTSYSGITSRGKVFKSSDGTAVTFISDSDVIDNYVAYPSGFLMMRDGTRFRIDSGNVTWMRDRNGNKVSFLYDGQQRVTTITDSLNRQITVSYYNPPSQAYDSITWKGYNNAQREIRVYYAALSTVLRSDFSTGTMVFNPMGDPYAGDAGGYNFDTQTVVSQVLLPNNQSYYFKYNPKVELAEVTLPTGGKYQYDWDAGPGTYAGTDGMDGEWGVPAGWPTPFDPDYTGSMYVYRRVTERRVRPDGSTLEGVTTYGATFNISPDTSTVTVNRLDASYILKAQDKHYFYGFPFSAFNGPPTSYAPWQEAREYQTEVYDTNGSLQRRVAHTWQQRAAVTWFSTDPANPGSPPQDPRITATTTTLADVSPNLVTTAVFV